MTSRVKGNHDQHCMALICYSRGVGSRGAPGAGAPPTFHRPLQFVYSIIVCVDVCGDSKCFTILHFTCTTNHKIHDHTCNF